jgi:5'-nucleotidase
MHFQFQSLAKYDTHNLVASDSLKILLVDIKIRIWASIATSNLHSQEYLRFSEVHSKYPQIISCDFCLTQAAEKRKIHYIHFNAILIRVQVCTVKPVMLNSNSLFGDIILNILVTNDDGVYSDGLWAVVEELKPIGQVTVVAPDRDQSGAGTSVTLRLPVRLHKIKPLVGGVTAFRLEGTPADCVIMALRVAVKDQIDLVVSGINEGSNLGNDVFISGTVGAAIQGYAYGISSIAVSIAGFSNLNYDASARVTRSLATAFKERRLPRKLFLNVNLPNLDPDGICGIEVTKLGERSYVDRVDHGHDGKREYYWIVRAIPEWNVIPGTDVWALEQNRISIMPFPHGDGIITQELISGIRQDISGHTSSVTA